MKGEKEGEIIEIVGEIVEEMIEILKEMIEMIVEEAGITKKIRVVQEEMIKIIEGGIEDK